MLTNCKISLITSCLGTSFALLFTYLTFIPAQTFAETSPNPDEHRKLSDITKMQEMNAAICYNTTEIDVQYRLEDIRENNDNKTRTYWVAKLADGNCWMTQNLDFDIPTTLDEYDSDVDGSDVPTGVSGATDIGSWTKRGNTFKGYADPGDYFYANTTHAQATGNLCQDVTSFDGSVDCQALFKKAEDIIDDADLHYHVGNYYSWSAATVGSGDKLKTNGASAEQSICPKGWKLPLSHSSNNSVAGSFYNLLKKYGVQSTPSASGGYAIYSKPLYFVYSGFLNYGKIYYGGYIGGYWSRTSYSDADSAYRLFFRDIVDPLETADRYYGFSVRCVNDPKATSSEDLSQPAIPPVSGNALISVNVSPVISIDASSTLRDKDIDFTRVAKGEIIVDVGANQTYQVLFSTNQPNMIPSTATNDNDDINNDGEADIIPMTTISQDITPGTNAWGIKKKQSAEENGEPGDDTDAKLYSPVGTNGSTIPFFISRNADKTTLIFQAAVSIHPLLPSDTYTTEVIVTGMAG